MIFPWHHQDVSLAEETRTMMPVTLITAQGMVAAMATSYECGSENRTDVDVQVACTCDWFASST